MNTYGNENIQIRDLIAKNEDIIKEALNNKLCDELYDLYFLFKTNEKYLGSLYATSYIYKKSISLRRKRQLFVCSIKVTNAIIKKVPLFSQR